MALLTDFDHLVDEFAARMQSLDLSGDEQEEYSAVLNRLENQVDRDEPSYPIVVECARYLSQFPRAGSRTNAA
jgi:hypothetical protein